MRTLHRIAVPVTLPSGHMSLSVTLVPEGCSNTHFNLILKAVFVFLTTACTQPSSKTALSCPLHLPVIPTQGPLASFCLLLINAPCPGLLSQPDYYLWRPPHRLWLSWVPPQPSSGMSNTARCCAFVFPPPTPP